MHYKQVSEEPKTYVVVFDTNEKDASRVPASKLRTRSIRREENRGIMSRYRLSARYCTSFSSGAFLPWLTVPDAYAFIVVAGTRID